MDKSKILVEVKVRYILGGRSCCLQECGILLFIASATKQKPLDYAVSAVQAVDENIYDNNLQIRDLISL